MAAMLVASARKAALTVKPRVNVTDASLAPMPHNATKQGISRFPQKSEQVLRDRTRDLKRA
jgi:hypothetical protein